MPNETVVQYILTVDTDKAENSLEAMSKEGNQVKQTLDSIGKSSGKTSKSLGGLTKQTGKSLKGVKDLRRAGRDLDGALQDISQGVSLLSPAMGGFIQTLSRGASIAEGFGRIGAGILNPAILGVGAITLAAGVAIHFFNQAQEEAAAKAEKVSKELEETNKNLEKQATVITALNVKLGNYISKINDANIDLALLTGTISAFEVAQDKATQRVEKFRQISKQETKASIESAKLRKDEIQKTIIGLDHQLTLEKDIANALISTFEQSVGVTGELSVQGKKLAAQLKQKEDERSENNKLLAQLEKEIGLIDKRANALEKTLQKNVEITEKKRKDAEQEKNADEAKRRREKNADEAQRKRDKEDAEAEKRRNLQNKEATARLKIQSEARNKLNAINVQLTNKSLTKREQILAEFRKQRSEIRKLGFMTGENQKAREAELQLIENTKEALKGINTEEEKRVTLLKAQLVEAQALFNIIALSIGALSSPESMISNMGGIVSGIGGAMGMAGLQAAGPAIGAAGSALTATADLGAMVQQVIDESLAANQAAIEAGLEEIPLVLDEESGRKVVYDNMIESFDIFFKNLERGLEILPEIIVRILPEFVASLTKVLADPKLIKLIAIDIPLAILRTIPSIIMTVINEIGYAFANVVETLSNIVEILRSILSGDFFRQDRDMGQENRQRTLERWFPGSTDTGGLEAADESSGGAIGRWIEKHYDFGSLFGNMSSAQGGMRFTGPGRQGLAMLHQNEFVVPASGQRPQSVDRQMSSMGGGGVNITINSAVVEQNAIDALVRKIEERFNSSYGLGSSNLFGGR